jgi:hypothetical protein
MAISYDVVSIRNAMLDTITTRAGNAALLRIYDSTGTGRPSTGGAVTTQVLLAELTCGTPFAAGAAAGVLTLGAITQDASANNTGTATWFRIVKADGTTFVLDGNVGKLLDQKMADKNFLVLGWMELGSRNITNSKRPIKTMEDLKGLKIRLQPNETHLATFRALGANAVAMDVKELYSAMEQKVLDGQENPFPIIRAGRYNEVQKYLSNSGHFFDFILILANKKSFEALKPEHQKAIRDAMNTAVASQRAAAAVTLSGLKRKVARGSIDSRGAGVVSNPG